MNPRAPSSDSTGNPAPQAPDFDLVRPIGEGGFGTVWLAVNRTTGQPRAVKFVPLKRSGGRDPAGREISSLIRLESSAACRHASLLAIHHVGQTDEHLYYVMDLADDVTSEPGSLSDAYRPATLEARLDQGALSAADCSRFAGQLLAALACLHRSQIVHRDVKPANCLFVYGELKLADFGLATAADLHASRLGTVRYMPPDGCMDARADVYAAGLVLYEMLTGLPVDRFPSLGVRAREIARDRTLSQLNRLALKACDPDPGQRFHNAEEMLSELSAARGSNRRVTSRRRTAILTCIAILSCGAYVLWPQPACVDVNFVSEPFEATIYLNGELLVDSQGTPYRTPCTVPSLPATRCRAVFKWEEGADLDVGTVDLRVYREFIVRRSN